MNIKQNNRILNFGATSELSKEILSRVAKKLNPVGVDGVVSPKAKEYLSTFSSWATSQGVSDELKRYMLPLPKGHQSTCPDAAGLEKTILKNALFDEAMKNVIKEMYQESSQMNFADERFSIPEGAYSAGASALTAAGLAYLLTEDEEEKAKNALLAGTMAGTAGYLGATNTEIGKQAEGKIRDFISPQQEQNDNTGSSSSEQKNDKTEDSVLEDSLELGGGAIAGAAAMVPGVRKNIGKAFRGVKNYIGNRSARKVGEKLGKEGISLGDPKKVGKTPMLTDMEVDVVD